MSSIDKIIRESMQDIRNAYAERLLKIGTFAFYFAGIIAALAVGIYVYNFGNSLSDVRSDWGVFGDFLGGLLNPVVGLITVYLVLVNARLQRQELRNSIEEMKNSNIALEKQNSAIEIQHFQNTFFNWMETYRSILADATFTHPSGYSPPQSGTAAVVATYTYCLAGTEMERAFGADAFDVDQYRLLKNGMDVDPSAADQAQKIILQQWRLTKSSYGFFIGGILRSLSGMILWISSRPNSIIPSPKKHECAAIIKAHLSYAELALLFYESWGLSADKVNQLIAFNMFEDLKNNNDPFLKFMLKRAEHLTKIALKKSA